MKRWLQARGWLPSVYMIGFVLFGSAAVAAGHALLPLTDWFLRTFMPVR